MLIFQGVICYDSPPKKVGLFPLDFWQNVRQHYEVDSQGGGFKRFVFQFSPLQIGEDSHFDGHIFQLGWFNHQPVIVGDTHIPPFHLN